MSLRVQFNGVGFKILVSLLPVALGIASATSGRAQNLLASTNPERVAESVAAFEMTPLAAAFQPPFTVEIAALQPPPPATASASPQFAPRPYIGRFEISQWGTAVNNHLGQWYGGSVDLFLTPSPRLSLNGSVFYQRRPGEIEQGGAVGATIQLAPWFHANLGASGGGPDDSTSFIPRYRYDLGGTLATPIPGFLLNGGWTRLEYGNPVSGRILRAGFVQYAGKVVLQGSVNFNNTRPGNRKSVDGTGTIMVGQEGRYWVGLTAGGGREAWQSQGVFPTNVEFDGYHLSLFTRHWITPAFGIGLRYNYYNKRTAYNSNGGEIRFFWQF